MRLVNSVWINTLRHLVQDGKLAEPRNKKCRELLGWQTVVDMNMPVMSIAARKLSYKFMAAEAAWILSGDNRVSTIKKHAPRITEFSDDGLTFHGAYGPKVIDQIPYVAHALSQDRESRQAVINIWRERPVPTKDVPCTVSLQFMIRDNRLHCFDTMRSSDIWLGWPYDVFNMSMISRYILLYLKNIDLDAYESTTELGNLYLTAGSMHLYEENVQQAFELLTEPSLQSKHTEARILPSADVADVDQFVDILWNHAT